MRLWQCGIGVRIIVLAGLALQAHASTATSQPGINESPLFFEINRSRYVDPMNVDLLPAGKLRLQPLGVESVSGFDWVHHRRDDQSWWQQIERCTYLLPFIESNEAARRRVAEEWFYSWYLAHEEWVQPNPGAWDGMTAGMRVMVFVLYLKNELQRSSANPRLIETLEASIDRHQEFLAEPGNFELNNHGMWQAVGLFETARVAANAELAELALARLQELVRVSVSDLGVHREHSPSYHVLFSAWLADCLRYFDSMAAISNDRLSAIRASSAKMQAAAYYLCDHGGNVPQIGDTDAQQISPESSAAQSASQPVLFDRQAGYAVWKDPSTSRLRRYIVFNIQTRETTEDVPPSLTWHFHHDVGAVYFSNDGEIILSDQGRFDYSGAGRRLFFVSPAAHNVIFPTRLLNHGRQGHGVTVGDDAWRRNAADRVVFGAALFGNAVRRELSIPREEPSFVVVDSISPAKGDYTALWNIGPGVADIQSQGVSSSMGNVTHAWLLTAGSGRRFRLELTISGAASASEHSVTLLKGARHPVRAERSLMGWYSPSYQEMIASPVIKVHLRPAAALVMTTRVSGLN